jgi:hypothetical protein
MQSGLGRAGFAAQPQWAAGYPAFRRRIILRAFSGKPDRGE